MFYGDYLHPRQIGEVIVLPFIKSLPFWQWSAIGLLYGDGYGVLENPHWANGALPPQAELIDWLHRQVEAWYDRYTNNA